MRQDMRYSMLQILHSADKVTVSKLSGNKKYYVRVRTYTTVNGIKYYGAWSAVKTVTTKK